MFGQRRRFERMFTDVLDADERLKSYAECTPTGLGRAWLIVTDRNVGWIEERPGGTAKLMPHQYLLGYRMQSGYVRFGWQSPDDPAPLLLTVHAMRDPLTLATTVGHLNVAWSAATGEPHQRLRNPVAVPPFESK